MEAPRRCLCGSIHGPLIEIFQEYGSGKFYATIECELCHRAASWSIETTLDAALQGLLKQWNRVNPIPMVCAYCKIIPVQTKLENGTYQVICSVNACKQSSPCSGSLFKAIQFWNTQQEAIQENREFNG